MKPTVSFVVASRNDKSLISGSSSLINLKIRLHRHKDDEEARKADMSKARSSRFLSEGAQIFLSVLALSGVSKRTDIFLS